MHGERGQPGAIPAVTGLAAQRSVEHVAQPAGMSKDTAAPNAPDPTYIDEREFARRTKRLTRARRRGCRRPSASCPSFWETCGRGHPQREVGKPVPPAQVRRAAMPGETGQDDGCSDRDRQQHPARVVPARGAAPTARA
jgi:hypothetical protein